MSFFAGQQWRRRHKEQIVDTAQGEEGEGGTNRDSRTETHTLTCVKQIASDILLYDAGSPNPMTYIYLWLIHFDVWQKPTNMIKQLSSNEK